MSNQENNQEKQNPEFWAIIELFGRQRLAGKISEYTFAGKGFIRVDVPENEGQPAFTKFVAPESVYALNPVTKDVACHLAKQLQIAPISPWEIHMIKSDVQNMIEQARNEEEPDDRFDGEY